MKKNLMLILFCLLFLSFGSSIVHANYISLWDGIDYNYGEIPFDVFGSMQNGVYSPYALYESPLSVYGGGGAGFVADPKPLDSINIPGYTGSKLHLLNYSSWAGGYANGTVTGKVNIYYDDDTFSTLELIIGTNTDEWSYDSPWWGGNVAHTKVPGAYNFTTNLFAPSGFEGHFFYASIDLEAKPIASIELALDSGYKVDIASITLEGDFSFPSYTPYDPVSLLEWTPSSPPSGSPVPEPTTLLLLGAGLAGLFVYRKKNR